MFRTKSLLILPLVVAVTVGQAYKTPGSCWWNRPPPAETITLPPTTAPTNPPSTPYSPRSPGYCRWYPPAPAETTTLPPITAPPNTPSAPYSLKSTGCRQWNSPAPAETTFRSPGNNGNPGIIPWRKPNPLDAICKKGYAYYRVDNECDSYIKCTDFVAEKLSCPDGLHYNPKATWPSYPCGYPMDVSCVGRGAVQEAQPTRDCPHQDGYFASPVATSCNCGVYLMCVDGKATEMTCPPGLAFNPERASCDWPENVAACNADQFLGFSCPAASRHLENTLNYRYKGGCHNFFSCVKGHARLLSCDAGLAFDPALGRCVDADYVNCDVTNT